MDLFEVRVVGSLGLAAKEAFAALAIDLEPTATILSGELDQETLYLLLDQVQGLGFELMDVHQVSRGDAVTEYGRQHSSTVEQPAKPLSEAPDKRSPPSATGDLPDYDR